MDKTDDNDKGALLTCAIHILVSGQCSDEVESGRLHSIGREMGEKLRQQGRVGFESEGVCAPNAVLFFCSLNLFPFHTSVQGAGCWTINQDHKDQNAIFIHLVNKF